MLHGRPAIAPHNRVILGLQGPPCVDIDRAVIDVQFVTHHVKKRGCIDRCRIDFEATEGIADTVMLPYLDEGYSQPVKLSVCIRFAKSAGISASRKIRRRARLCRMRAALRCSISW